VPWSRHRANAEANGLGRSLHSITAWTHAIAASTRLTGVVAAVKDFSADDGLKPQGRDANATHYALPEARPPPQHLLCCWQRYSGRLIQQIG
jgi:hypothetical protein